MAGYRPLDVEESADDVVLNGHRSLKTFTILVEGGIGFWALGLGLERNCDHSCQPLRSRNQQRIELVAAHFGSGVEVCVAVAWEAAFLSARSGNRMDSHPVEVVGRIRSYPDGKEEKSAISVLPSGKSLRVKHDQGYRDFGLDGVSIAEEENLRAFYTKYVEARVDDVRAGGRCTVMMYGPTGAGKSHTMFGSSKEPGVAYLALHQIMMNRLPSKGHLVHDMSSTNAGLEVSANVIEIYNEEVYDLLASNCVASPGPRSVKAIPGRARLEVRGRKVKNATCISGADPVKLVQEISKVEKRRVVKSTASNERSSRSHCMVVLDVFSVGGKLILVDMAGSENSDQAGNGQEAKLQTGKINQGNGALKRVVECIANGDPYIPYRDSKLTMLLQDSFEEDGAKMLMILCVSPDTRDAYKTLCTLEYGAKAKCIVRLPCSPPKETATFADGMEAVLQARLRFKDECIMRLRQEYEQKEKEREEKAEELASRETELLELKSWADKLEAERAERLEKMKKEMDQLMFEKGEELKKTLELELQMNEHKLSPENYQHRLSDLEELIKNQKQEIAVLRLRAEKAESQLLELQNSGKLMPEVSWTESGEVVDMDISNSICISSDFSKLLRQALAPEIPEAKAEQESLDGEGSSPDPTKEGDQSNDLPEEISWSEVGLFKPGWLPIIPEEADDSSEHHLLKPAGSCDERADISREDYLSRPLCNNNLEKEFDKHCQTHKSTEDGTKEEGAATTATGEPVFVANEPPKSPDVANRIARIQNIFLLCGNHRELAAKHQMASPSTTPAAVPIPESISDKYCIDEVQTATTPVCSSPYSPLRSGFSPDTLGSPWPSSRLSDCGQSMSPAAKSSKQALFSDSSDGVQASSPSKSLKIAVYVKWESKNTRAGKLICVAKVCKNSSLLDLRKEIQLQLPTDFLFLILGDLGGAPVDRENEPMLLVSSLPLASNENESSRVACLRAVSPLHKLTGGSPKRADVPFKPLDNQILPLDHAVVAMTKPWPTAQLHGENVGPLMEV